MKSELRKILIDLIYTSDAKPRFIGGDVDAKLTYIEDAINKIEKLYEVTPFDRAYEILCVDDEGFTIEEMVDAIKEQDKVDNSKLIDYVDGVYVWEKLQGEFTCNDFLIHIGLKTK